ncbi:GrpB family protein [Fodinicola feengrottensis]|uniref:GrpB family protein n=1 Tax=Fodinicola feengrottensis TaxID=435914 RepID=UPI0036F374AD
MRSNDTERERYAARKRELAQQTWQRVQDYADAKTEVIRTIVDEPRQADDGDQLPTL